MQDKKKARTILYVYSDFMKKHEINYSGIAFWEFIKYLDYPIRNMALIKAEYIGNKYQKNFEIIEGVKNVTELAKQDIYKWGDFCFIDYKTEGTIDDLSDQEIAELLYLGHMFKPLNGPFFDVLQNRLAYLAHDDGWFCKLFCKGNRTFTSVLTGKIKAAAENKLHGNICTADEKAQSMLLDLAEQGFLIDLDTIQIQNNRCMVDIYVIGKSIVIDDLLNKKDVFKKNASKRYMLFCDCEKWELLDEI